MQMIQFQKFSQSEVEALSIHEMCYGQRPSLCTVNLNSQKAKKDEKNLLDQEQNNEKQNTPRGYLDEKSNSLAKAESDPLVNPPESAYVISIFQSSMQHYQILVQTQIDQEKQIIIQKGYITKNGAIIKLRSPQQVLLLQKSCLKINALFKAGCLTVDSQSQQLMFKNSITLRPAQFNSLFNQPQNNSSFNQVKECLQQSLELSHKTIRFQSLRLLVQLGEISIKENQLAVEFISKQFAVKPILPSIFDEYENLKGAVLENRKAYTKEESKLLESPTYGANENDLLMEIDSSQVIPEFRDVYLYPTADEIRGGQSIIKKIELTYTLKNVQQIHTGSPQASLNASASQDSQNPQALQQTQAQAPTKSGTLRRYVAIKYPLPDFKHKLSHQIQILQYLESYYKEKKLKRPPFFPQCYLLNTQRPSVDKLIMDYYLHGSLDAFMAKFSLTLSLHTRLYILYLTALGIRELQQVGVVHMDLKPQNILISKSLVPKITDFAEALIMKDKFSSSFEPGLTFEYAAPEFYRKDRRFATSYDVFSFAVIIFETIIGYYPFYLTPRQKRDLSKAPQFHLNLERATIKDVGPLDIVSLLMTVVLRSFNPEPEVRPEINKLILVLKQTLGIIDKLY